MTGPERFVFAFAVAALLGGAVVCATAAFRSPRPRRVAVTRRPPPIAPSTAGAAIAAAVVVLVVTRWVVAAVAAAVLVVVWSSLFQSAGATAERRRVAAIAKWLEDLRDLQRGSNLDLPQALDRAALRAPKDIDNELARFVDRVRHHTPIERALLELAADLDHPTSDLAIAAMLFAYGHASGSTLYDTFEELAATARDELTARDQIDRVRVRVESSMRRMIVILGGLIAYLLIASHDTVAEYSTPAGQAWLVVPIAIWGFALWWLRKLSRYRRGAHYLDYDAVAGQSTQVTS
jgi:Type II secretion system (T2SS), protein F